MADPEKPVATADRSSESNERTEGSVSQSTRDQIQFESNAPVTPTDMKNQFTSNLQQLGIEANGQFPTNTEQMYRVALNRSGDGVTMPAPPKPGEVADGARKDSSVAAQKGEKLGPPDGKIDAPKDKPLSPEVKAEVEKLNGVLSDKSNGLTDEQRRTIERSAEMLISGRTADGSERKPPLGNTPEEHNREVAQVLRQENRMFEQTDAIKQNGFDIRSRNMGATAMINDIANPPDANQGANNTCQSTSAAKVEMMTHPGAQAQRYVDMFARTDNRDANGRFVEMPNGQKVYFDKESVTPDAEAAAAERNRSGGMCDAYMRGLNHLNVNAVTQEKGEYYVDRRPTGQGDTGERLMVGGFNSDMVRTKDGGTANINDVKLKDIENSPNMGGEEVQRMLNKVGGGSLAIDGRYMGIRNYAGLNNVQGGDAASLERAWNANGGKPMSIAVDTNSNMFRAATDVGGKTPGGGHVVTLTDRRINPETGKAEYFMMNSWGEKYNGWVPETAIASAMNPTNGKDRSAEGIQIAGAGDKGGDTSNWQEQRYKLPYSDRDSASGGTYAEAKGREGLRPNEDSGMRDAQRRRDEAEADQKRFLDDQRRKQQELDEEAEREKLRLKRKQKNG